MNKRKEILVLGFALFAMFFGAGNLIFPPSVGYNMGKDWFLSGIGFLLTAAGLPLLGVLAFIKVGELENFSIKISRRFNNLYCSILVLVIGPLFAIPRTGSTTIEMGVLPLTPNLNPLVVSIIASVLFFGITLALVLKESKITDIIGKFLTPIILIILFSITIIGIFGDFGTPIEKVTNGIFTFGFIQGYQTMDALAAVLFGVVVVKGLEGKGIINTNEQKTYLTSAGVIAILGLGLIYLSLMYLGARISGINIGTNTTGLALYIAQMTLGSIGKIAFGICVAAACLTTSVGLTALTSDWFSRITPFSYRTIAIATSLFSTIMAIGGVDFIVKLSVPVLCILYPITIVLIMLNIVGIENKAAFRTGTYISIFISIIEVLGNTFKITSFTKFIQLLPLGKEGFAWLIPCILGIFIAYIISSNRKKYKKY
ncbi:branched-chain amino acid transport system II carrier protein [Fusobacterium perfoetens]|uniref:branched-chain amino acid transport system II carrier protein n=1 Tax=Fusobacterium perfoetens TaxID=852 RepID=UPI00055AF6D3|nr:branched-chain amino acid transport system II carrier protein [Fusobacterium perfoetens]MCI6152957.1 branched-chain amino acid transport system II carrier protein [Fusobacterium perfoetens]MDY3237369.1 branched-chain amino acid transport system II carrier protein [Fusobacterium perfoetens]